MNAISIPWFGPDVGDLEQSRAAVIASNYINDGRVTRELEQRIAERIGVKHCVGVTSGTAAISLAHIVEPDDEMRVPDPTFIATASAARMIDAEVIRKSGSYAP
jgi:perosamine synthetase